MSDRLGPGRNAALAEFGVSGLWPDLDMLFDAVACDSGVDVASVSASRSWQRSTPRTRGRFHGVR